MFPGTYQNYLFFVRINVDDTVNPPEGEDKNEVMSIPVPSHAGDGLPSSLEGKTCIFRYWQYVFPKEGCCYYRVVYPSVRVFRPAFPALDLAVNGCTFNVWGFGFARSAD